MAETIYVKDGFLTGSLSIPDSVEDYNIIANKPSINGVTLDGDVSFKKLGLDSKYVSIDQYNENNNALTAYINEKVVTEVSKYSSEIPELKQSAAQLQNSADSLVDKVMYGVKIISNDEIDSIINSEESE